MSDASQGPGWWYASDGKWYPPELAADYVPPTPAAPVAAPQGWGTPTPNEAPSYTPPASEPAPYVPPFAESPTYATPTEPLTPAPAAAEPAWTLPANDPAPAAAEPAWTLPANDPAPAAAEPAWTLPANDPTPTEPLAPPAEEPAAAAQPVWTPQLADVPDASATQVLPVATPAYEPPVVTPPAAAYEAPPTIQQPAMPQPSMAPPSMPQPSMAPPAPQPPQPVGAPPPGAYPVIAPGAPTKRGKWNFAAGAVLAEFVTMALMTISLLTRSTSDWSTEVVLVHVATAIALVAVVLLSAKAPFSGALAALAGAVGSAGLFWTFKDSFSNFPAREMVAVLSSAAGPLIIGLLALGLRRTRQT